ncbi:MAG: hypothetical protein DBX42_05690 [Azospirillum sp.]|nr:MAG: hypothetical protein DBX42_05690 [Azospirillum sp.]
MKVKHVKNTTFKRFPRFDFFWRFFDESSFFVSLHINTNVIDTDIFYFISNRCYFFENFGNGF